LLWGRRRFRATGSLAGVASMTGVSRGLEGLIPVSSDSDWSSSGVLFRSIALGCGQSSPSSSDVDWSSSLTLLRPEQRLDAVGVVVQAFPLKLV